MSLRKKNNDIGRHKTLCLLHIKLRVHKTPKPERIKVFEKMRENTA